MQDLIGTKVLKMTSLEIAELVNSRHDHVKVSIGRLSTPKNGNPPIILLPSVGEVKNHLGQMVGVYFLNKRDSLIVVAQLSPEFTARIVDRWQELEDGNSETLVVPKTLPEALRLAADLADQLAIQAPKVAVYEQLADRKTDVSTTVLAKQLDTTATKLNRFLRDRGIKWLNADLPKAGFMHYFNVISDVKNEHEFQQCLITPAGQIEITKLWLNKT